MSRAYLVAQSFFLLLLAFVVVACTSFKNREYAPFVRELDGNSVLEISTYPADFADRTSAKGAVMQSYESHGALFFQIFVRAKGKKAGPNPYVESMTIHSFSYSIDGAEPRVLLQDYASNFWMQGNPRYEQRELPPIPYRKNSNVTVRIDFSLNGTRYQFEGDMPAKESSSMLPTAVVEQSI